MTEMVQNDAFITGGAYGFERATISLTQKLLSSPKKVTLIRHGLSSWNEEGRIQVYMSAVDNIFLIQTSIKFLSAYLVADAYLGKLKLICLN